MKRAIAFNIGRTCLKVLEFSHSLLRGIKPARLRRVPVQGDWERGVSKAIEETLSDADPHATPLCLLPGHLFLVRRYSFPISLRKRTGEILPFEMEDDIPMDIKDVVFDYLPSLVTDKTYEVIVFLLPAQTLEMYLNLFPEERRPEVVIPEHVALSGLKPLKGTGPHCLIGMEPDRVSMVLFSEGMVRAARAFAIDGEDTESTAQGILETLKLWQAEDVERLQVIGEGAGEVEEALVSMGIRPSPCIEMGPLLEEKDAPSYLSLIGLANIAMEGGFNLARKLEEPKGSMPLLSGLKPFIPGLLVVLLLGGADLYLRYHILTTRLEDLDRGIKQTFHNYLPQVKRVVNESAQLREAIRQEEKKLQALKGMVEFDPLSYLDLLYRRSLSLRIHLLEVSLDEKGISFEGETDREEAIKTLVEGLRKERGIKDAELTLINRGLQGIRFSGRLTLSTSGP